MLDARHARVLVPAALILAAAGCSTIYYSVWEKLGYEKRDLLRSNVEEMREDQQEVGEQFESALEKIRAIYGLEGGDLEKRYDALNSEYERATERADDLRGRIRDVEDVAQDLFREWKDEAEQISDAQLRRRSLQQLSQTRARYARLADAMQRSEKSMDPVLTKLRDQVLFLKHNLNAQAIGSVEGEALDIEQDIRLLIDDLQASIRRADEFISQLPE